MSYTGRDLILAGFLCALAIVMPMLFHALGLGSTFLPMFIPIVIAGFILPWLVALTVGISAPMISTLLTGMPPIFPPLMVVMMVEGIVLTLIPVFLFQKLRTNIYITLVLTLLADRLLLFYLIGLMAGFLKLPAKEWGFARIIQGLPGIVLILIVIPPLVLFMTDKLKRMALLEK
jgi:hypothetical protein